jgi:DNA repair photolyase
MQQNAGSYGLKTSAGAAERTTHSDLKVRSLLRPHSEGDEPWYWALNPYEGCELGCVYCPLRLDRKDFSAWRAFEQRIGVKTNAVATLARELRSDGLDGRPVVLGAGPDPWQPAEEHFRLTRSILEAMNEAVIQLPEIDLRIRTRSSLIARDTDLLIKLAARGRVTVAFSIASLDERINRLLEPKAPSAFRRLAALEALARAGLTVGVNVGPVMPGLDEDELGLEPLLTRAANAGARFAELAPLRFGPGQRETFLTQATLAYPEAASRFRRVIGRRAVGLPEDDRALRASFDGLCTRMGLVPLVHALPPKPVRRPEGPAQLVLFDALPLP